MELLAWNCRGLNLTRAVRSLLEVWRRINPDVCFLSETHLGKEKAENLKRRLGCDHLFINESDGRSGGLLMLWRKEFVIHCQSVSQYFIDVVIKGVED